MERDYGANRKLRRLLLLLNMSEGELAERSGIPYRSLCRALKERRPLYADELLPLARALGVTTDKLLDD